MDQAPFYLTAPLALAASSDPQAPPSRFSGIAYSGAVFSDWGERVVIDLASTQIEDAMPLLHEHQRKAVIGAVTAATNDGATLSVAGELFTDLDEEAAQIAAKAARGARYQMSIGLFDVRTEVVPPTVAPVTVNGQTLTGPLTVLRGGLVREVSIVTLGADRGTNAAFFSAGLRRTPPPRITPCPTRPLPARHGWTRCKLRSLT